MDKDLILEEKHKKIIDTVENLFSFCTKEEELRERLDILDQSGNRGTENVIDDLKRKK